MAQRSFLAGKRKYIAAFIIAWVVLTTVWSLAVREPLLEESISLVPPGRVAADVRFPYPERYDFVMRFSREGRPYDELVRLFEDERTAVPVNIEWRLSERSSGTIVQQGSKLLTGTWGWSEEAITRYVTEVQVPRGQYVLDASILEPMPSADSFPRTATLSIRSNSKNSETWQMAFAWSSTVYNAIVLLVCLVLVLYFYGFRRGGGYNSS